MSAARYPQMARWVVEWILSDRDSGGYVDILNKAFVNDFILAFSPHFISMPYGAYKVPILGPLLSRMFRAGVLNRRVVGLKSHEWGFPNWVYVYQLGSGHIQE